MLTRNIGVREVLWNPPLVYLELQCIYFINISRNPVDKKQPYSYNQQPQEGPLLLLRTFFIPHAHPVGLKCGLVTLALFAVVA